jgi:hypothetical protein
MVDGNRDRAPAAAAYGATPPAAPPNTRERNTISALAGARRRSLGAAVAQSRACGEDQAANTRRKSDSPKLLTATLNEGITVISFSRKYVGNKDLDSEMCVSVPAPPRGRVGQARRGCRGGGEPPRRSTARRNVDGSTAR